MFINLYPHKQLRKTRLFFLRFGLFSFFGGSYALVNEAMLRAQVRPDWLLGAVAVVLTGFLSLCVWQNKIRLKDAFFSMTPHHIKFRLTVFGKEQTLLWDSVSSVRISGHQVVFCLKSGDKLPLRTGAIQSAEVAHHVRTSIRLAAMEKRITVNDVPMEQFAVTAVS